MGTLAGTLANKVPIRYREDMKQDLLLLFWKLYRKGGCSYGSCYAAGKRQIQKFKDDHLSRKDPEYLSTKESTQEDPEEFNYLVSGLPPEMIIVLKGIFQENRGHTMLALELGCSRTYIQQLLAEGLARIRRYRRAYLLEVYHYDGYSKTPMSPMSDPARNQ